MKSITINGSQRESVGKSSTKALRNAGKVPCVVYGGDCLLYTSDAADDVHRVDLGGRRIIKKNFFSSRRRHTRCNSVSWARRCV